MYTALIVLHLIVCLFLIFIILIQSSKGAEMGAAFGGSSQTLFGSRGAATFMNKMTTTIAILFMVTSLILAIFSSRQESVMSSVAVEQPAANGGPDTTSGPIQEEASAPGQGEADKKPAEPEKAAE